MLYLVLLVLGHEIVHVGLSLGELHLIHALAYTVIHIIHSFTPSLSNPLTQSSNHPVIH